ncbi:hypothetical protein [Microbacterium sp. GXF7504]
MSTVSNIRSSSPAPERRRVRFVRPVIAIARAAHRRPRVAAWAVGTGLAVAALTGCTAAAEPTGAPSDAPVEAIEPAAGEDILDGVPEACRDAFPLAMPGVDAADLELMPADWPAPPSGAVLCTTMDSVGGGSESAGYAIDLPVEDVFAHYEASLSGYELFRSDGAENGTGYATLDGVGADVGFQVRETDGGFTLVFVTG